MLDEKKYKYRRKKYDQRSNSLTYMVKKKCTAQKISANNVDEKNGVAYNRPKITLNNDYAHPYMYGRC